MKKREIVLTLNVILILMLAQSSFSKGAASYDLQYKFVKKRDDWFLIDGYEKSSFITKSEIIYEILDTDDDCIEVLEYEYFIDKFIINLTNYYTIWKAPIGMLFIQSDHFDYYYNSWLTEEHIYDVYTGWYIGTNFTDNGIRKASNRIFDLEISGYTTNAVVNKFYNENTGEYEEIKDNLTFNSTVYVEYDINGVLIKSESIYQFEGDISQGEMKYFIDRVQEFDTNETRLNLIVSLIAVLTYISISRILKRKRL